MAEDSIDRMIAEWARTDPSVDAGPLLVIGRLLRGADQVQRALGARLRPFGLSYVDFDVLNTLRRRGDPDGTHPRDLAEAALVTTGAMTARIDRLERAGLVDREPDRDDRRAVRIRLTAEGERLAERSLRAVLEADEEILRELSAGQRSELAAGLKRLLAGLEPR